jgi:hypothetical protein
VRRNQTFHKKTHLWELERMSQGIRGGFLGLSFSRLHF